MRPLLLLLLPLALLSCGDPEDTAGQPQPGELMAGFAQARIPAPLGIGTAGFGPFDSPDSPTPFADIYPGTTRIHGHPDIMVTVISRGEGHELIFVRTDTVGIFQQLRRALVLELQERLGRDVDDALLIGATHTHSGPGRVVDGGGIFDYLADTFFPEYYANLVDTLADTVEAALSDQQPARVGHVFASCADGHNDRRCEDGLDYTNDTTPIIAIERDGELQGLVMAYAVHGTILGIDDLTLCKDTAGGIEQAVEDSFDHPVQVMMFNAWGADMSPGSPEVESQAGATMPDGYDRMEQIGSVLADAVQAVVGDVQYVDEPEIAATTYRVMLSRDWLGYTSGEFPYEYGGVYCAGDSDCELDTLVEGQDQACIPFSEDYPAPDRTELTVGRLGDLYLTTFTGEPGTLLAESIMEHMQAHEGVEDVMFLGYTQDYTGYSILEDDWWQGGYEASGHLWGPLQGEYLAEASRRAFDHFMDGGVFGYEPPPVEPFGEPEYTPYAPITPLDAGTVATQVLESYGPTDTVVFSVYGRDPWLGAPTAWLETASGEPVLRPNGEPVFSDGLRFWIDLTVDPPYEEDADARAFAWQFSLPVQHTCPVGDPGLQADNSYRLRVEIPDSSGGSDEVISASFAVVE